MALASALLITARNPSAIAAGVAPVFSELVRPEMLPAGYSGSIFNPDAVAQPPALALNDFPPITSMITKPQIDLLREAALHGGPGSHLDIIPGALPAALDIPMSLRNAKFPDRKSVV